MVKILTLIMDHKVILILTFIFRVDPSGKPVEDTDEVIGSPLLEKVSIMVGS